MLLDLIKIKGGDPKTGKGDVLLHLSQVMRGSLRDSLQCGYFKKNDGVCLELYERKELFVTEKVARNVAVPLLN